jgi:hypothetical protein
MYQLTVAPPDVSNINSTAVLGSPVNITVKAGQADAAHCSAVVSAPAYPLVGTTVSVQITLADVYGNLIDRASAAQGNTTRLVIYGEC